MYIIVLLIAITGFIAYLIATKRFWECVRSVYRWWIADEITNIERIHTVMKKIMML